MTSPLTTFVIGGGALLASPALYAGFVAGTLPMGSALVRFAVAVLVVWIGVTALRTLVDGTSEPARVEVTPRELGPGHAEDTPPA